MLPQMLWVQREVFASPTAPGLAGEAGLPGRISRREKPRDLPDNKRACFSANPSVYYSPGRSLGNIG